MMLEKVVMFIDCLYRKNIPLDFAKFCTKDKEKRIPNAYLNESLEKRKWFFIGFLQLIVIKK